MISEFLFAIQLFLLLGPPFLHVSFFLMSLSLFKNDATYLAFHPYLYANLLLYKFLSKVRDQIPIALSSLKTDFSQVRKKRLDASFIVIHVVLP